MHSDFGKLKVYTFPYGLVSANMFVVVYKNEALVIDPCVRWEICDLQDVKVKSVLCTHGHFDHISEADSIISEFSCPIFIDEKDLPMLSDADLNHSEDFGISIRSGVHAEVFTKETYTATQLGFSEKIFTVHIIPTPGHTDGSVCFRIEENDPETPCCMFTGDMLFLGSIGRTDLGGSYEKMEESIELLKTLPDDMICLPGHGPQTILGNEKKHNPYFN